MSHSTIIIGFDGEPFEYFPPHNENDRQTPLPSILSFCDAKETAKALKKEPLPASEIPREILTVLEEFFG